MHLDLSDIAFQAFVLTIAILLINSGSGGRQSRVPIYC
jgi:hypothetical protein